MRLQGKTALVTAAGQGMGRASVLAMAAEGATVWATDVKPELLRDYEGMERVRAVQLDVLDKDAIHQLVAAMPVIDVLFNCAGFVHNGTVLQASDEEWNFALNLNVRSQYWAIQAALPRMLENGGGRGQGSIINMASVCSSIKGLPNRFIYGTTKAAVIGLTKSVAADYVTHGIRCNAICPGTVDTPSLHERMKAAGDYEAARKAFIARQPMGRLATAEEIAPLVVYLASDESTFVTGQAYAVDGGITL
jgi:2-keto-3-deoxy-L-fuconate dehydrogenase